MSKTKRAKLLRPQFHNVTTPLAALQVRRNQVASVNSLRM
jgi:hypothetical protein